MTQLSRKKWFLPAFMTLLGVGMLAAMWVGGHALRGVGSLGIMAAAALALLAGGRSETVRGLRGDGRDERFAALDQRATAFAGTAVIAAIVVAWLVEVARGHGNPQPYAWLALVAAAAYVVALVVGRVRG